MLILVGVTINVAINGGLFDTAKVARADTEKNLILEELIGMATWTSDGINVGALEQAAKAKYGEDNVPDNGVNGKLIIIGKFGTYEYKVTQKEISIWKENSPSAPTSEELETYILGTNKNGRYLWNILNEDSYVFQQDPENATSNIHNQLKLAFIDETDNGDEYYIRYNRDVYKFDIDENENTVSGSLQLVNSPEGNLGKYVTYKGNTWIVLTEDSNNVELITAETLNAGGVQLGSEGSFEEARSSYNNAIEILTQACKDATGITENIRSVGIPKNTQDTTKTVVFSQLDNLTDAERTRESKFESNISWDDFEQFEGEVNGLKVGDENYLEDYNLMKTLGILAPDTIVSGETWKDYWIASRYIYEQFNDVTFYIRGMACVGIIDTYNYACNVNRLCSKSYNEEFLGVRPVITINASLLEGKINETNGTRENPIIIED